VTGANLTGANPTGATSGGIIGVPSTLPAGWQLFGGGFLVGDAANLTNAANLTGSTLTGVTLTGANSPR
jgi:uncharacterized protein YjbI with pentapeptide repeats